MPSVATSEYWDALYQGFDLAYREETLPFRDLFERFLPQGGSCFEVGCYPGNFLIYLGRRQGYTVSGIDSTRFVERVADHLRAHGVRVGEIEHGDFLTHDPGRTFDVVCSFGFLEHFTNFREVIERQARLVAPGGTLVLSCPNFRRVQFLLHWLLDRHNLRRHHLPAMDLAAWREVIEGQGLSVVHSGYWRTADFWVEDPQPTAWRRFAVRQIRSNFERLERHLERPNRWTSPFMITIARREP